MSREEAIEILSEMRAEYNLFGEEEEATRYHVLSWAIQAMKDTQMGDLIDRKETIRAWCKLTCGCEPVKHGHWIEEGYRNGEIVCSNCGEPCATFSMLKPRDRFCKWCGARMEGEEDETD